ncbi:MAG TPA: flagellar basal body P-ring protein FlgI [Pirellulales bacterium]|jgi:flagellar P-ring protein precursor FlgI|nr:flagellar basal body P-ring protein FlgI [Pirellulales bacterium]
MHHSTRWITKLARAAAVLAVVAATWLAAVPVEARVLIKNICRVKGQEENTLQGLGIVMGLKGTGDGGGSLPTMRPLMTALRLMGNPIDKEAEVKDFKNVALVMVTATVPAAGARQGDKLDCTISSIGGAKSLAGGYLFMTPLQGPRIDNPRVFALAQGPLHVDDIKQPLTAKVYQGCRLEEDFFNVFTKDGKITLVINKDRADFQVAQDIAEVINSQLSFQSSDGHLARALSAVNVEVRIPIQYREDPVLFVAEILSIPILEPQTDARVVVNEKTGSIVISGDIEIGSAVVTHKNMVIETGGGALPADRFVPVDPSKNSTAKLKGLVEALNAVKVDTKDIIDIIKGLERDGKLHGTLIIE